MGLGWKCRRHVGDMSPTRQNVANFCPDRPILATWFLVCRLTFVSLFPDIDGPRTDQICLCVDKYIHTVFPCGPPFHTTTQGEVQGTSRSLLRLHSIHNTKPPTHIWFKAPTTEPPLRAHRLCEDVGIPSCSTSSSASSSSQQPHLMPQGIDASP